MGQGILGSFVYFLVMKNLAKKILLLGVAAFCGFAATACVYEPEQYIADDSGKESGDSQSLDVGTIYAVNKGYQICNPSISQDTEKYPGAMLWLNFSGSLGVTSEDSTYNVKKAGEHDRLTVSDSTNKVLWFVKIDTAKGDCEFQDPEWSTHGNFIVTLRAYDKTGGKCKMENRDFGIIAIRMSDKKRFTFYSKEISSEATPHLWIDPTAEVDTTADDSTIEGFFGTRNVRLTYVAEDKQNILFVDFADVKSEKDLEKALANPKKMIGPDDAKKGYIESQLFSPDGKFVVYNVIEDAMTNWNAYIQKVDETSSPVLIEKLDGMISAPAQPHWFKYDSRLFVTWAEFPNGETMTGQQKDLLDESMHDGSGGRTAMREISLDADAPADLAISWVGNVRQISPMPTIGGRSSDGRYIATGDSKAFLIKLP